MVALFFFASATRSSTICSCLALFSGPNSVAASKPSPTLAFLAMVASSLTKSSKMDRWQYTRLIAQQICPVLAMAPKNTFWATSLTLQSARTMAASLPPISSVMRFMSLAHPAMIFLPVGPEPVNEILLMRGWLTRCAPMLNWPGTSAPVMTLKTPGGKTSFISMPMATPVRGVKGDGLCTNVLPRAMAGAHFWTLQKIGKFQGVMPATTPTGRRCASTRLVSSSTYTSTGGLISEDSLRCPIAIPSSMAACAFGFPCSITSRSISGPWFSSRTTAALCTAAQRWSSGT
mmetsp:Transcript_27338/g.68638  ORF Transcript_27338/g.68638 Transcript_27338/m.68638 type:complete len:289 (+) Transcript_27338:416-1282(+)